MTSHPPRLPTLDVLRGIAVMGILLANIAAFALPEAAYFSPRAWGGTAPADIGVWFATFVLVEGKMRGLFSLLFGASMLLVVERAEASGGSGAGVHYRRMAWLFALGCIHLYALWWGDILAHYALCGAIAYPFIRMQVSRLIVVALILIAWQTMQGAGLSYGLHQAVAHTDADGRTFLTAMAATFGVPPALDLAAELAAYRGSYADVFTFRWAHALSPLTFLPILGPETLATMLLGMAGLKSGFLTGTWPRTHYVRWAAICLGITAPIYAAVGLRTILGGFALTDVVFGAITLAAPLRNLAILGFAALGILLIRPGGWLTLRVAAAGRMAFSNYIATTLVMTTLFYGYGASLFGHLSRAESALLVPVACVGMLAWSKPWLARFRYGPLEWLWRSLAGWQIAPLLRPIRN